MIEVRGLQVTYRQRRSRRSPAGPPALWDVDLSVGAGEFVALLGANGAGKTTLMKVLVGVLRPTAGHVRVLGVDPHRRVPEFLRQITLVSGGRSQLVWDLPVETSFDLNRAAYGLSRTEFAHRLHELDELIELRPLLGKLARSLSLGQRMRAELALGLLHRPRLVMLDEPTLGLDIIAQQALRDFLRTLSERAGATVLLTTHYMGDVQALADRVVLLQQGRKTYDGPTAQLRTGGLPAKRLTIRAAPGWSPPIGWGPHEVGRDGLLLLHVDPDRYRQMAADALADPAVLDLWIDDVPLEEAVASALRATTEDARG